MWALGASAILEAEVRVAGSTDHTRNNSTWGRNLSGCGQLVCWGGGVGGVGIVGSVAGAAVVGASSAGHLSTRGVLAGWAEGTSSIDKSIAVHA